MYQKQIINPPADYCNSRDNVPKQRFSKRTTLNMKSWMKNQSKAGQLPLVQLDVSKIPRTDMIVAPSICIDLLVSIIAAADNADVDLNKALSIHSLFKTNEYEQVYFNEQIDIFRAVQRDLIKKYKMTNPYNQTSYIQYNKNGNPN